MTHPQAENGEPTGWAHVQEVGQVLRPIWLTAILTIAAAVALQMAQAVEILVDVADRGFFSWAHFSVLASVVILALCAWYFARTLLLARYWFTPKERPSFDHWRRWVPRLLGTLPALSVAVAYARSCFLGFGEGADISGDGLRFGFALFYLIVAALLISFFVQRRKIFLGGSKITPTGREMPDASFLAVSAILTLSFLLLILFWIFKVSVPQAIGPLAIVLYAIATWIAFGSLMLVYPTYRFRWPPLVLIALLLTAVFSPFNDNHGIGESPRPPAPWERDSVSGFFRDHWLPPRLEKWQSRHPGTAYPVVLVAAEGGGIRAAYWTAAVLGTIENRAPGFGCHVFALSGVSGGSLGNAVYAALVADGLDNGPYRCPGGDPGGDGFRSAARDVLGHDFLAPLLAGMFFPDFVQRFLPVALLPDRAEYLERSWEDGWNRASQQHGLTSDRFEADFRDLWSGGREIYVPSLFLNGTWVDTGGRLVASNLEPEGDGFVELEDAVEILDRPLRLSTAVHLSARFTYASPAGTLRHDDKRRAIVDGGYFENSGALTATEILGTLETALVRAKEPPPVDEDANPPTALPVRADFLPIVLVITNGGRETGGHPRMLPETLAPAVTLLNTRLARGYLAEEKLRAAVAATDARVTDFRLSRDLRDQRVPLGWVLSKRTRAAIDQRFDQPGAFPQIDWLRGCLQARTCDPLTDP